jgi:signal peptidase II
MNQPETPAQSPQQALGVAPSSAAPLNGTGGAMPSVGPGPQALPAPARGSFGAWALLLGVSIVGLAIDLGSKAWAFSTIADVPVRVDREAVLRLMEQDPRSIGQLLPPHEPVRAIPGLLELTLVLNPGAVFGMGPGQRWIFKAVTVAAVIFAGWMFLTWMRARDRWAQAALGLLVAGGLGNLYDRTVYACVRDFLHPLPGWTWPWGLKPFGSAEIWPYVSNVADAYLIIGIVILFLFLWRHDGQAPARRG